MTPPQPPTGSKKNRYCCLSDLSNEASVEQFFVSRMLEDLGYRDSQIKTKETLDKLATPAGRKKLMYRPDYALMVRRKVRWILDAKATDVSLDDYVSQCSGYCLNLNQRDSKGNPAAYFVLSNGVTTRVYEWDREDFILELLFADFVKGNSKYQQLQDLLKQQRFSTVGGQLEKEGPKHVLRRQSIGEMNAAFAWCHQFIYRKDNLSQAAAFMAFVKIIFLKLLSDRDIHDKHPTLHTSTDIEIPACEVRFSKRWIEERESDHANPLDALQFQTLIQKLEREIKDGKRKRIFDPDAHLTLSAETIKGVVERLEEADLYSIDADLNGRLFETFLNATMRGKDLGQYFTPRSIVKMAVKLARVQVSRKHQDVVVDACCGSGGFLIDVLADMWEKVEKNKTLTSKERQTLKETIANERVFGVDVARDPALARIARMNMYLHGDGGSRIYQADVLDPAIRESTEDAPELAHEKSELRDLLEHGDGFADVVITNPPFAKDYQRKYPREAAILDNYNLSFSGSGGGRKPKKAVKSSLLFLERYHQILKPGGRMVTVVDDSILGASKYAAVRKFIREHYIVKAVVSLPGDAFQRSRARVKTSLLCLEKKKSENEDQPSVFMYYCTTAGLDDPARRRVLPIDVINRKKASSEITDVDTLYSAFLDGDPKTNKWSVPAAAIEDRMDVKNCLPTPGRNVSLWKKAGFKVITLGELVDLVDFVDSGDDVVMTDESDEIVTHLRVRYDGFAEAGEQIFASDSNYKRLYRIHSEQLVMSHIGASYGAVAIVPEVLGGSVVTSEYSVFQAKSGVDPRLVWMLVRTPEARADLLMRATGISRNRVQGEAVCALQLPMPQNAANIVRAIRQAEEKEREARAARDKIRNDLETSMDLDSEAAQTILAAFKPPN